MELMVLFFSYHKILLQVICINVKVLHVFKFWICLIGSLNKTQIFDLFLTILIA